jgi:hypothetical protein
MTKNSKVKVVRKAPDVQRELEAALKKSKELLKVMQGELKK